MTIGIYIITNKINNKIYIGKSKNIERRWKQYAYDFKTRKIKHINEHMLNSMTKYGYDNFDFKIQEECEIENLSERELFWMNHYESFNSSKGYNLRVDTESGMLTHDSTRDKISARLREEWKNGIRSGHGLKLKESWDNRDRKQQSELMSKTLTKYRYKVTSDDGSVVEVLYKGLFELNLHSAIGSFKRCKCDIVRCKGFTIERVGINV